jgi:hypothetical protein
MKTSTLLICLLYFLTIGCEKIGNETDPAKIILGKWKIIELGSWPTMSPYDAAGEYVEFCHDSIKIFYNSNKKEYFKNKYWIDTLLHEDFGYSKFEFFDKNQKMRLDFASGIVELPSAMWRRIL